MNIFNLIVNIFSKKHFTGVLSDLRKYDEKEKDFLDSERIASAPSFTSEKIINSPFPIENQNYTSSCVYHAVTLALGIELVKSGFPFTRLSKMFGYRQRSNYPDPGSILDEAFNMHIKEGACIYEKLPTPLTEDQANALSISSAMVLDANKYEGIEYYHIDTPNNFDTLVARSSEGHGVAIILYATEREYSQQYVYPIDFVIKMFAPIRHCVCVLPNGAFIENGKRYLTIQDSAWFGGIKIRYLSEEFITKRVYGAGYFNKAKFTAMVKPKHTFQTFLTTEMRGDEVLWLQRALNYEGLLPDDCLTGYFGGRTFKAVKDFQVKYRDQILTPSGLSEPTGIVANATNKVLNQLYSQ